MFKLLQLSLSSKCFWSWLSERVPDRIPSPIPGFHTAGENNVTAFQGRRYPSESAPPGALWQLLTVCIIFGEQNPTSKQTHTVTIPFVPM